MVSVLDLKRLYRVGCSAAFFADLESLRAEAGNEVQDALTRAVLELADRVARLEAGDGVIKPKPPVDEVSRRSHRSDAPIARRIRKARS